MPHIAPYAPEHREAVLELSLRAWEPIFPVLATEVPAFVYSSFYPRGWRERQYADLATILDAEPHNVDLALEGDRPVGWICTRLHPEDAMGEIYVLVVDPDYQRQGIGNALMERAFARSRAAGMSMVMVETVGDSGHAPARAAYESAGFQRWPVARYFKNLDEDA